MDAERVDRRAMRAELVEVMRKHYPDAGGDWLDRVAFLASNGLSSGALSDEAAPLPPTVRVEATYPASDGRVPEQVVVIWETGPVPVDVLNGVIGALALVPGARDGVRVGVEWGGMYPTAAELVDGPLTKR